MPSFVYNSDVSKQALKASTEKSGGSKRFRWPANTEKVELLILPPTNKSMPIVFTAKNHEYWANGNRLSACGTPAYSAKDGGTSTGEDDKIMKTGWKLREIYEASDNDKVKNFFKNFLLRTSVYVNVLDMNNIDAGPMMYKMPSAVSDQVLDEMQELNEKYGDFKSICDFDEGRLLVVKSNGKEGIKRKYTSVKFGEEANLIRDGIITDEDIENFANSIADLTKTQIPYNKNSFDDHYKFLIEKGKSLGIDVEADINNEDAESSNELATSDYSDYEDKVNVDDESLVFTEDEDETKAETKTETSKSPARRERRSSEETTSRRRRSVRR